MKSFPDTKSRKGRKMTFGRCHFNFLGVRSPETKPVVSGKVCWWREPDEEDRDCGRGAQVIDRSVVYSSTV